MTEFLGLPEVLLRLAAMILVLRSSSSMASENLSIMKAYLLLVSAKTV